MPKQTSNRHIRKTSRYVIKLLQYYNKLRANLFLLYRTSMHYRLKKKDEKGTYGNKQETF